MYKFLTWILVGLVTLLFIAVIVGGLLLVILAARWLAFRLM